MWPIAATFTVNGADPDTNRLGSMEQSSGSELLGTWHLVQTHNSHGRADAVSIMHRVDTSRSDLNLAGLTIRRREGGTEAVIVLGRGLINTQPNTDGRKFDKGKIIGCEPVVAGGDTTTLLDLVEEPLDQVSCSIEIGAEADYLFTISFRRDICPRALLTDERPNPVRVISSICQQHRSWTQSV